MTEVIQGKYVPCYIQMGLALRQSAEGTFFSRLLRDPRGAGVLTALLTLPLSLLAATATPLGMLDVPLMACLFYLGGSTVTRLLGSPARQLAALGDSMASEERLLESLFRLPTLPAPR